ncbi:acyl-CoA dehydrogenase family protein [Streptomyces caniscabiei]|uniref:Acyl-CoA/acyl-ACP dehydrogenase n=1 Tax=Streptomyces caniscabiei TaxID=2746961 RepID=A0A927QLY3_9ACTN|nr:acyl-CoA dehydrogenase family protein [Streptomyces caniscabiei]MBD9725324.1 acyl-CoA/acyl-ACP dehydrogenase [Streptomyces caniscabiei]MDX3510874.1 acyl-CoA/acyl-ACP dehydrogenase [Streptomyces caniscabiei]MDX3720182.1 acyl-CoA/acyl-ACP dehydrogenase [Streptomyces caniscabiei]WEO29288.1 acyl-CoA/acyl-ACP dehydrogenase [Streptomyces caniscabiei]
MTVDLFPGPIVTEPADPGARPIRETVLPVEDRHRGVVHPEAVRVDLQCAAKETGFFAPHVAAEYDGHGRDMRGRTVVFEEAGGSSVLGPPALNIAAPDRGTMHLLEVVTTPGQKERHLRPLATGEIRSRSALTQPAPGAGSDPAAKVKPGRPPSAPVMNHLRPSMRRPPGTRSARVVSAVR